jgi:hypothetical protein
MPAVDARDESAAKEGYSQRVQGFISVRHLLRLLSAR